MPDLLTLSPYSSKNPSSGGTQRIHHLNLGLARQGWDVLQFSWSGMGISGPYLSRWREVAANYREYRYVNPAVVVTNRILRECAGPQIATAYLPPITWPSRILRRAFAERDVVLFEHPHLFDSARRFLTTRHKVVLDAHNIEFALFADKLEERSVAGAAARRLRHMEGDLFRRADLVFTCTAEDREAAIRAFGVDGAKIEVATNGSDASGVTPPDPAERTRAKAALGLAGTPVAYFAGSRWGPNVEAVIEIARLAAAVPEVHFLIAGRAGEGLAAECPGNVTALGFVEDLRPYLAAADIALNPMLSGGGSNIKMFDYMAESLPVLSTPFGARGLEFAADGALEVCEIGDFAARLKQLVAADDLAERGRNGRRLVLEHYDWGVISARMAESMRRLS
jgi:glycosyltransferase involved in cell wall biosynthesis